MGDGQMKAQADMDVRSIAETPELDWAPFTPTLFPHQAK